MNEPRWQFSLRSLLVLTAIVSICLAIGVHFAGFMLVLVVVTVMQAAIILSAEWLIRPANRRALAFVTAGSWIVMGSGSLIVAAKLLLAMVEPDGNIQLINIKRWEYPNAPLAGVMLAFAVVCYCVAAYRWRKLTPLPKDATLATDGMQHLRQK